MTDFLILLFMQVTVFSSVAAAIILAIRKIFRCRIPPRIGMLLWLVLFVRLVCPVFPESVTSVYNFFPIGREIMYSLANDVEHVPDLVSEERPTEANPYVIEPEADEEDNSSFPVRRESVTVGELLVSDSGGEGENLALLLNRIILFVYAGGAGVFLTFHLILYRRVVIKSRRDSVICTDEEMLALYSKCAGDLGIKPGRVPLLRVGKCSMLAGVISPSVIYSYDTTPEEAPLVFGHELNHYKNGDNITLFASTIVVCCFWYNPLVWIVRNMMREDVEVWCDLRTIENSRVSSSVYAHLISRSIFYPEYIMGGCCMSSAGRSLRKRLLSISHWQKNKFLTKSASVILCAAIVTACLTNPVVSENSDYSVYIENYASLTGEDEMSMHLSLTYTASDYIEQLCRVVGDECSPSLAEKLGGGSYAGFMSAASGSPYVDEATARALSRLESEGQMNELDCALINGAAVMLISEGGGIVEDYDSSLPACIRAGDMAEILSSLSDNEGRALLSWYNRGVKGAEVKFERFYTSAMMELITSRINNVWYRSKIRGFYREVKLDRRNDYSRDIEELRSVLSTEGGSSVYVLDPTLTGSEAALIREILGAAWAGEREDVYYLKKTEDGCPAETALAILKKSGYSYADVVENYASLGKSAYTYISPDDCAVMSAEYVSGIEARLGRTGSGYSCAACCSVLYDERGYDSGYVELCDYGGMAEICDLLNRAAFRVNRGDVAEAWLDSDSGGDYALAVQICGELGLLQNKPGDSVREFDPFDRITCGEGLYRINKLASSVVNRY